MRLINNFIGLLCSSIVLYGWGLSVYKLFQFKLLESFMLLISVSIASVVLMFILRELRRIENIRREDKREQLEEKRKNGR